MSTILKLVLVRNRVLFYTTVIACHDHTRVLSRGSLIFMVIFSWYFILWKGLNQEHGTVGSRSEQKGLKPEAEGRQPIETLKAIKSIR